MKKLLLIGTAALLAWWFWSRPNQALKDTTEHTSKQEQVAKAPQTPAFAERRKSQEASIAAAGAVFVRDFQDRAWLWGRGGRKGSKSTQVVVQNTSEEARDVRLFGANQGTVVAAPTVTDVEDHALREAGQLITPQGMAWHPGLQQMLICSQVADELLFLNAQQGITQRWSLSSKPGTFSPVEVLITLDENIWVLGLVANAVRIYSIEGELLREIGTARRPTRLLWHPVNQQVLVYESLDESLLILDRDGHVFQELFLPAALLDATVDGLGRLILDLEALPVLLVYDTTYQPLQSLDYPEGVLRYHAAAQQLWLGSRIDPLIYRLNLDNQPLENLVTSSPVRQLLLNPANGYAYAFLFNGDLSVYEQTGELIASLSLALPPLRFYIRPDSAELYAADPIAGTLYVLGYAAQSSKVQVDADYAETARDLQQLPVPIRKIRLSQSADSPLQSLQLVTRTATGKEQRIPVSLSQYTSPQHAQPIIEVDTLEAQDLGGNTEIRLRLPPNEQVSLQVEYGD